MPHLGHVAKRGCLGVRLAASARDEGAVSGGGGVEHRGAAASHGRAEMLATGWGWGLMGLGNAWEMAYKTHITMKMKFDINH